MEENKKKKKKKKNPPTPSRPRMTDASTQADNYIDGLIETIPKEMMLDMLKQMGYDEEDLKEAVCSHTLLLMIILHKAGILICCRP